MQRLDGSTILVASKAIANGGLIIYPTDTLYGLGCDPMNAAAVRRVFLAKGRDGKPIPVLCDSLESAQLLASLNPTARRLASAHWPGGLTIIAPLKVPLPEEVHNGTGLVGVRVPDSPLCAELLRLCGGYLTGTSANVSGERPCVTARAALAKFGKRVDLVLDGGKLTGPPSTVVKVVGRKIIVLRRGRVGVKD